MIGMPEEGENIALFFYEFPLWGILLITLGILFVAFEGGFLLGRHRFNRASTEKDSLVAPMVGAMLGLLAFMLTFTFGSAASHFNTRRHLVLDEANAIRSTYGMAQMLGEVPCDQSQKLLREYVDIRLKEFKSFEELNAFISRSNEIQNQLGVIAMTGEIQGTGTPSAWLYVQSLSEMINMQAKRLNYGEHTKISAAIWFVLYGLAVLGMSAMGYHAGLVGIRGFFVYPTLILAFSIVMVLIYDLDRPKQTLFKVSQQSMIDLRYHMNELESSAAQEIR
jgi:uncharacterized Tic20 family protein